MTWILAHGNATHLSEALWGWWTWDPLVLFVLALSAWLYVRGLRRLWARAGVGQGIKKWEAGAFAAGWLPSCILGALLTVARRLWYPIYEARTMRWNLDPLQDQQLAGLLMWVPAGVIFLVLGLALFAAWLGEAERRVAHTRSETLARLARGTGRHG